MKLEDRLKSKAGTRTPYQVPDGYFVKFKGELLSNLPEYPEKPVERKVTAWQKIRPYFYLAAMFAGIWCMMKIFHNVSSEHQQKESLAAVAHTDEDTLIDDYDSYEFLATNTLNYSFELEEEVAALYPSIDEFKSDFYSITVE